MAINMKWMESFLKSFDLFGESFTFKIKKKKYYTSLMGGITSFGFIIYSLYYLIYNLSDFFSKNIRTSEKETKMNNKNSVSLKDHQYLIFFFCLRDSKMKIDNFLMNHLNLESDYIVNNFNNSYFNSTKTPLHLNTCSQVEFKNSFNSDYTYEDFSQCKCLNLTSIKNMEKDFELRSDNFYADKSFLKINLKALKNTENQDINEYLFRSDSRLYLHFPTYYIEAKDLVEPLKREIHTEVYKIKSQNFIDSSLDFSVINFKDFSSLYDDDSFNNVSKLTFDKKESINYYSDKKDKDISFYLSLEIGLNMKNVNFYRNVLRYDDFLGNLVGYLSNIIIILYFFNTFYNSFRAQVYFSEKFFIFNSIVEKRLLQELKYKNKNNDSFNFSVNRVINNEKHLKNEGVKPEDDIMMANEKIKYNSNLSNNEQNIIEIELKETITNKKENLILNENNEHIRAENRTVINYTNSKNEKIKQQNNNFIIDSSLNNQHKIKKNTFRYNFFEYILLNFCCCFYKNKRTIKKQILLDNSNDLSDYYMDINLYIRNMIEIEFIKNVIFQNNKEFKSILNYFKPALKDDYSQKFNDKLSKLYSNKFNEAELEEYINSIRNPSLNNYDDFLNEIGSYYNYN